MPPRAAPRRQVVRKIKEEPDDDLGQGVTTPASTATDDQPSIKVDQEDADIISISPSENSTQVGTPVPTAGPASATEPASSSAASSRTRGAAPVKRFQTRAGIVRRSEAERKKAEQEEEDKRQRRLAEAARGQRGAARGARGAARGRGAAAGVQTTKATEATGTSWAFERTATPSTSHGGERVISSEGGEGGGGHGGSGGGYGSGSGLARSSTRAAGAGRETVHEEEEDPNRTDIEHINLISDGEDEAAIPSKGRRKNQKSATQDSGLRPIRLEKHEHVNRAVGVAATKLKAEQDIKAEAIDPADVVTKVEDAAGGSDAMQLDHIPAEGTSLKKEVEIKPPSSPVEHKHKAERKRRTSSKDLRLAHETVEEQQERARYEKDLRKISRELGSLGHEAIVPDEGPSTMLDEGAGSLRDGKLYLFQLPPMTPMLVCPDDFNHDGPGDGVAESTSASTSTPVVKVDPRIKKEPGTSEATSKASTSTSQKLLTAGDDRLPGGIVGKLNVHQSGKVTLDWGGTSMVVNWGTEVDFLQDAVLAVPGEEGQDSTAYSMAPVRSKLVVTPDWQKIYE